MTDLWTTAAEETLVEITSRDLLQAKFAAAPYRHVVQGAKNATDFENRLSFIDSDVRAVTGAYYEAVIAEWKQHVAVYCGGCGKDVDISTPEKNKAHHDKHGDKETPGGYVPNPKTNPEWQGHETAEQRRMYSSYEQERGAEDDALVSGPKGLPTTPKPWEPDQYTQGPATDALKDGFAHSGSRKQAWTSDGSDITPLAQEIMDASDDVGWGDYGGGDDSKRAHDIEVLKTVLEPFAGRVTQADMDVLEDYNYHTPYAALSELGAKTAAHATDIIGYTYDADYHCPSCTIKRFGQEPGRSWAKEDAEDSEGNPVHPIFVSDEWHESYEPYPQTLNCSDCGTEMDRVE